MFPVKHQKSEAVKKQYVYATEDLTNKDIEKLRSVKEIHDVMPCSSTIDIWRSVLTEPMNELDITETDLGLFLDCQKWCILMLSKYLKAMEIKEQKDTVTNPLVTVVATVDYAKGAKMTVCGLQLCHPNINQDSSNNYHVNCVYIGAESGHHLKQNCSNLISFLASDQKFTIPLINEKKEKVDIEIALLKELLLDKSCIDSFLGASELCIYCKLSDECKQVNEEIFRFEKYDDDGNVEQTDVKHTFYDTFDLDSELKTHFPGTIVNLKLIRVRMDWLLHGFKALVNNFINSLYSSFLAAKDLLQRQKGEG